MGRYSQIRKRTKKLDKVDKEQLKRERIDALRARKERKAVPVDSSLEITMNTRKSMPVHVGRKYRAPRTINEIRRAARARFQVNEVKIDSELNREVWSRGIAHPPQKIRLLMTRRVEETGDKPKHVVHVSYLPVKDFKGLQTRIVEETTEEA